MWPMAYRATLNLISFVFCQILNVELELRMSYYLLVRDPSD